MSLEQIEALLLQVDEAWERAVELDLDTTAHLLQMAQLELRQKIPPSSGGRHAPVMPNPG